MLDVDFASWQIDGEKVEKTDFIFLGSKITVDGDCSRKIKKCLLLGRKAMTNLDSIFKSRDITLPTKVHIVKAVVLPVVMYGCESWIIKKAEHWRIDAFELWCWKRLLRVPRTARRSNQSILKEISPEYSLEGLMLKFQYFGLLMKSRLIGKDPDAGKDWGKEEKRATEGEMVWWHLILCRPLLLLLPIPPSIRIFSNESALCIRWPQYWSFNFSISLSSEYSGLISFYFDWFISFYFDSQKSSPIPQFKSTSSSVLSLLYDPTLTSIHDYWENHSFDYTNLCQQSDVFAF